MKIWAIPATVLVLLLALSLLNSAFLDRQCADWTTRLEISDRYADEEDWEKTRESLQSFRASWEQRQTYLHVLIVHEEIDAAQSLLERCTALAEEEDAVEYRGGVAELISQVKLLSKMEKLSIKNIL